MRVAIVAPARDNATIFYRVYLPMRYWSSVDPVIYKIPGNRDSSITVEDFCKGIKEDVVIIHRVSRIHAMIAQYLHVELGKRIIFDTDDQEYNLPKDHHLRATYRPHETKAYLDTILKSSNEVWVTTKALQQDMAKMTTHTINIIPNAVDILDPIWHYPADNNKELINIGWVGGVSHLPDLAFCTSGFKKLIKDGVDFKLTLCGMPKEQYDLVEVGGKARRIDIPQERRYETLIKKMFSFIPDNRLILKPATSLDKYPYFYKDIDIVIAPLAANAFNNCKSELKILEAAVRQLPAVVSRESKTYANFAWKNKDTIYAVNNYPSEWARALRTLIEDPTLREERGKRTYNSINADFNLTIWSKYREERIKDVFNQLP